MENENITNDDLKQYEALKPDLKKVICDGSSGLLLFIILFTFLPLFKINIADGQVVLASVFDEMKNMASYIEMSSKYSDILLVSFLWGIIICFCQGTMLSIRSFILEMDSDTYTWKTYCKIKQGDWKFSFFDGAYSFLLPCLTQEIIVIFYGVTLPKSEVSGYIGYLNSCNGISWIGVILLIIQIIGVVFNLIGRNISLKKIKNAILKEEHKA